MPHRFSLSIVIPVFNGASTIPPLIKELCDLPITGALQIILVVDGSTDNSSQICRQLSDEFSTPISVIDLAKNFGEHNAILAGLSYADGDHIITMDDDLQNPVFEISRVWEYARDNQFDVVYTQYHKKNDPIWRNIGSKFTNWCVEKLQDKPKGVYLSSFRCISAFLSKVIRSYSGPFPYIDGLILQATDNIGSIVVEHHPGAKGNSGYTIRKLLHLFASMLFGFSTLPLRIGAVAGALFSLVGLFGFTFVVVETIFFSTPPGWATITSSLFLLAGVQLLILWLIGEYLGRLFLTINQKPQFIVRSVYNNFKLSPEDFDS
jgi:undecaprenyl-phosphate 4-deoxy-4-formamido-L-arabinose transferase